jgi:non-ribosomal peptide synthetase component F
MAVAAAFATVLGRYAEQDDVSVGTLVGTRSHRELETLVGLIVNPVVLRIRIGSESNFVELLRRVREIALEAYTHQDVPFEQVVADLRPPRDFGCNPLFQTLCIMQNAPPVRGGMAGFELLDAVISEGPGNLDITLSVVKIDGRLGGVMLFAASLFDERTANQVTQDFHDLLLAVAHDPTRRLGTIPLRGLETRRPQTTSPPALEVHPSPGAPQSYVAPRCKAEAALAELWARVLGQPQISVFDNFFALGGHSLLACEVVLRMRDLLGSSLSVAQFVETPTIAGLAHRFNGPLPHVTERPLVCTN